MSTVTWSKKRIHQPDDNLTLIRRQNHRQKGSFPLNLWGKTFLSLKGKLSDISECKKQHGRIDQHGNQARIRHYNLAAAIAVQTSGMVGDNTELL